MNALDKDGPQNKFDIGPHQAGLRQTRPYFLVRLDSEEKEERATTLAAIAQWVQKSAREPVTYLFRATDLLQPAALVKRLQDPHDREGSYLLSLMGRPTRTLIELLDDATISQLQAVSTAQETTDTTAQAAFAALLTELNSLLTGPPLYQPGVFPRNDSLELLTAARTVGPDKEDHARINRQLLAYCLNTPDGVELLRSEPEKRGGITHIYVLSHGWHRNFFSAVSAYDRLMSRMLVLMHRRRLESATPYHPLFLTLHWHSDPGKDEWVDGGGRRSKRSFLDNVEQIFERPTAAEERFIPYGERFTDIFEDVFDFFSRISAPDTDPLDTDLDFRSNQLSQHLTQFNLRDAESGTRDDKVSAAWRCYFEARPKGVLLDQSDFPRAFNTASQSAVALGKFVLAVAGMWFFVALLLRKVPLTGKWVGIALLIWLAFAALLMPLCISAQKNDLRKDKRAHGKPVAALFAYIPLQILFFLPLLLVQFCQFIGGGLFRQAVGLYDERIGERNRVFRRTDDASSRYQGAYRLKLAHFARLPVVWLRAATAADSGLPAFIDAIDSQLAFWEMQDHGVAAGEIAARFLCELHQDNRLVPLLDGARIHLMGHSFGSLVVANTVRHLALDEACRVDDTPTVPGVDTLTLIEGAIASSWFEREETIRTYVKSAIACVFSGYDSANGFYYPLANAARCAAGYVGLTRAGFDVLPQRLPEQDVPKHLGLFASLVKSPELKKKLDAQFAAGELPPTDGTFVARQSPGGSYPYLLNLDASRIIYEGSVASGGGHGDIFKDDVIHLVWDVTRLDRAVYAYSAVSTAHTASPMDVRT